MKRTPKNPEKESINKKRKKKKWPIALGIVGGVVVVAVIAVIILAKSMTSGLKQVKVSDDEFGIEKTTAETSSNGENKESETEETKIPDDITNIVFLGIDREENRSDTMMVLSVNKTRNVLKVISILRDSKVSIEGCDYGTKLGYAYKWGGSAFAVRTINRNFHTEFNQYVTMNFEDVAGVVDQLGGVDVELTAEEARIVNSGAKTLGYDGSDACEGLNTLNGAQAVEFSRIRSLDGEYYRASRQQVVLKAMFSKIKQTPKTEYPAIIAMVLGCLETTLTYEDLLSFASADLINTEIERYTIPDEEFETDLFGGWETVEGWEEKETMNIDEVQWVWIYDLDKASDRLHKIIYGD